MDLFNAGFSAVPFLSETASKFQQPLVAVIFIVWLIALYIKLQQNLALHANLADGKVVIVEGVGSLLSAVKNVRYSHHAVIFRQQNLPSVPVATSVQQAGYFPSISCPPGDDASNASETLLTAKLAFPARAAGRCVVAYGIPRNFTHAMLSGEMADPVAPDAGAAAAAAERRSPSQGAAVQPEPGHAWPASVAACLRAAHTVNVLSLESAATGQAAAQAISVTMSLADLARRCRVPAPSTESHAVLGQLLQAEACTPAVIFFAPRMVGCDSLPVQAFVLGVDGECLPLPPGSCPDNAANMSTKWSMRFSKQNYLLLDDGAVFLDAVFGLEAGENSCCVCLTEPKEVLLLPCRHLCVCTTCFQQLTRCPVCRAEFQSNLVVRGLLLGDAGDTAEGHSEEGVGHSDEAADVEAVAEAMGAEAVVPMGERRKAQTQ